MRILRAVSCLAGKSLSSILGLLFLLGSLSLLHAAAQTTIHVPADQRTIQAGIDAAQSGDTVLVSPGTYTENINFNGKAITVASTGGASQTTIDGGGTNPTVVFDSGETRSATLDGFTIQHGGNPSTSPNIVGYPTNGGIVVIQSSPTIRNNIITQNYCIGIASQSAAPLIQNNTISSPILGAGTANPLACVFTSYSYAGFGIVIQSNLNETSISTLPISTPAVIQGNTIENNVGSPSTTYSTGGGILIYAGTPIIQGNIIRNNQGYNMEGGGITDFVPGFSSPLGDTTGTVVVDNLIYGNLATCAGGGISISGSIVNNVIANNMDRDPNGSTYCFSADSTDSPNNTGSSQIFGDISEGSLPSSLLVVNNIIYASSPDTAIACPGDGDAIPSENLSPFDSNLVFNSTGQAFSITCHDDTGQFGNIDADPLFVDAANGDFHLKPGSPAIDAGNNSVLSVLTTNFPSVTLTTDYSNTPRVQDAIGLGYPVIDMGAYEAAGVQDAGITTVTLETPTTEANTKGYPNLYYDALTNITLIAKLASTNGTPTGTVQFLCDGSSIGSSTIDNTGTARLVYSVPAGNHGIVAVYAGQNSSPPATSLRLPFYARPYVGIVTVSSSENPSYPGQSITFTINTVYPDGFIPPSIGFLNGSSDTPQIDVTLIPDSHGTATYTTPPLPAGVHGFSAIYQGDRNLHGLAFGSIGQNVLAPLVLTANQSTAVTFGTSVTFSVTPNAAPGQNWIGTISLLDGTTVLTSQSVSSATPQPFTFTTTTLPAGSQTFTAVFTPTAGSNVSTYTSTAVSFIVYPPGTTASVTASPNPVLQYMPVTLSAHVASTIDGVGPPSGSLVFWDAGLPLATVPLDSQGNATTTDSFSTAGTHPVQVFYAGSDTTFGPSESQPVSLTVNPYDYSLTASPFTVATQHSGSLTLNIATVSGFADTLTLTCGNLPTYATCSISPSSINLTSATAAYTATVTLGTTTASLRPFDLPNHFRNPITLAGILFAGFFCFRRRSLRVLALLLLTVTISSCSSGGVGNNSSSSGTQTSPPSTTPGTYSIQIAGSTSTLHVVHSINVGLTVTQ